MYLCIYQKLGSCGSRCQYIGYGRGSSDSGYLRMIAKEEQGVTLPVRVL